jgi:hypothetical protein
MTSLQKKIDTEGITSSIQQLRTYLDGAEIEPLISALEALKEDPDSAPRLADTNEAFNNPGIAQGAVLTYAPYLIVLISDDPYTNDTRNKH